MASTDTALAATLLSHLDESERPVEEQRALESLLSSRLTAARERWPRVRLSEALFIGALARVLSQGTDLCNALSSCSLEDLFLARACVHGDRCALEHFDREYLSSIDRVLERFGRSAEFTDEVRQLLRERLFVAEGNGPGRIADYAGRGPLSKWVQVAALRLAVSLRRGETPGAESDEALAELLGPDNPELAIIRARHREDFLKALRDAFAALTPRDRNLLRLQRREGLTFEQIGRLHGVHRTTVSAWIEAAHQRVLDETRRLLAERLQLGRAEFESLYTFLQSQLDVSLRGLLLEQR